MYLAPHDNYMTPLPSRDCVAIRHFHCIPDLACLRRSSSGMTGSANSDTVYKVRRDACGAKLTGVFENLNLFRISTTNSSSPMMQYSYGLLILSKMEKYHAVVRLCGA